MSDLLAALRGLGANLAVEGARLKVTAPRGVLTAELRAAISANRTDLLRDLLEERDPWDPPVRKDGMPAARCSCGARDWVWAPAVGRWCCDGCGNWR
ncbi:MAG: TubC N-terminal docking domain-related protein [Anaerolineae bacterium]